MAYQNEIKKIAPKDEVNVISKACPLFVPLVEEEIYDGEIIDATLKHYFKELKAPHAVILGCTHFPLISDALQNYFGKETILIHSGEAIVEQLEKSRSASSYCSKMAR